MPTTLRRVTRTTFTVLSVVLGAAMLWRGLTRSPIVCGASVVGLALVVSWLRRRERQYLGAAQPRFSGQDLVIATMLIAGLWVALYAVFSLGDVGTSMTRATSIPLGYDAAPLSIAEVLGVGLLSTIGVALLLVPLRRPPKKRRDVRETSLVARGGMTVVGSPPATPDITMVRDEH